VNFEGSVMEEPVMPRLARLPFIPFGWYYVALHSVTDRRMITNHAELAMALKLLRTALREKGARLHAGYVTEREAHLVLQAGEGPLSSMIGRFQHEYARVFNRIHEEHGSLFRLHHHLLLFQHQRWLVPLVHFIHWIRRLEASAGVPGDLWWSSDAVYRGGTKQDCVTTNVVLRRLTRGAYDRRAQEQMYRGLFDQAPDPSHARLFTQGSAEDPRLLGDARFITEVWRLAGRRSPDRARGSRDLEGDIPDVVMQVIEQFNALCDERLPRRQAGVWTRLVTYENVRSRSRKRPLPMVRALSAECLVEHDIATPTQAARFFGCGPRPVCARRRRFYKVLFRELFSAAPEIMLGPRRASNRHAIGRAAPTSAGSASMVG
jgi:hypothetical protein